MVSEAYKKLIEYIDRVADEAIREYQRNNPNALAGELIVLNIVKAILKEYASGNPIKTYPVSSSVRHEGALVQIGKIKVLLPKEE